MARRVIVLMACLLSFARVSVASKDGATDCAADGARDCAAAAAPGPMAEMEVEREAEEIEELMRVQLLQGGLRPSKPQKDLMSVPVGFGFTKLEEQAGEWKKISGPRTACVGGRTKQFQATTIEACRNAALEKNHTFIMWAPDHKRCYSLESCDDVKTGTSFQWSIYEFIPVVTTTSKTTTTNASSGHCDYVVSFDVSTPIEKGDLPAGALMGYRDVVPGRTGAKAVDLLVVATSPYTGNAEKNGVKGEFGSLNVGCSSSVDLTYKFVSSCNGSPVTDLDAFYFTFFDFDTAPPGNCVEELTITGYESYKMTSPSLVKVKGTTFTATVKGKESDNGKTPYSLDETQKQKAVSFLFPQGTSEFKASMAAVGGDPNVGRNIYFTGTSNVVCPQRATCTSFMPSSCKVAGLSGRKTDFREISCKGSVCTEADDTATCCIPATDEVTALAPVSSCKDDEASEFTPCAPEIEQASFDWKTGGGWKKTGTLINAQHSNSTSRPVIWVIKMGIAKSLLRRLLEGCADWVAGYPDCGHPNCKKGPGKSRKNCCWTVKYTKDFIKWMGDHSVQYRLDPRRFSMIGYSTAGIMGGVAAKDLGKEKLKAHIFVNAGLNSMKNSVSPIPSYLVIIGLLDLPDWVKRDQDMYTEMTALEGYEEKLELPDVDHFNWPKKKELVLNTITQFLIEQVEK